MSDDSRLTALETALAHAEAAIEDLSQVVQAQSAEIEQLKRQTRLFEARLTRLEQGDDGLDGLCIS